MLALRVSPELALQASSKTGAVQEAAATVAQLAYCNLACLLQIRISAAAEAAALDLEPTQGHSALAPSHLLFGEDALLRLKTVVGLA